MNNLRSVVTSLPLCLLIAFTFLGCNLSSERVITQNETDYTVIMVYRDGSNGDGSIHTETLELAPNSEEELAGVEFWINANGIEEFQVESVYAPDGPDLNINQFPGTVFWPLTVKIQED